MGCVNSRGKNPSGISATAGLNGEKDGDVRVVGDYKTIVVDGVTIDLTRKFKRRAFVRHVHQRKLKTGEDTFYYDEMREAFNNSQKRFTIQSERFERDLFKGQSKEFRLLFEEVDGASDLYRIKI